MTFVSRLTALSLVLVTTSAAAAAPLYFNLSDLFLILFWLAGFPVLLVLLVKTRKGHRYLTAAVLAVWAGAPTISEFIKHRGEERQAEVIRSDNVSFEEHYSKFCQTKTESTLAKRVPWSPTTPVAIELLCDKTASPNLCIALESNVVKAFHSLGEACHASAASAVVQTTDTGRRERRGYSACKPGQASLEGMRLYRLKVSVIRREVHRGKATFNVQEFYESEMTIVADSDEGVLAKANFFYSVPGSMTVPSLRNRCPSFESRVAELLPIVFPR
jgi:hypothetical protein